MGAKLVFPRRRWTAEVHAWLLERLQEPGLLCLDWDETCAAGDIGEALVRHMDADGVAWRRYQEDLAEGEVLKAYVESCFVLAGLSEAEAQAHCEETVEEALAEGVVQIRPEIQDLMQRARELGWEVWVGEVWVREVLRGIGGCLVAALGMVILRGKGSGGLATCEDETEHESECSVGTHQRCLRTVSA